MVWLRLELEPSGREFEFQSVQLAFYFHHTYIEYIERIGFTPKI
jgi:hypothetical protein